MKNILIVLLLTPLIAFSQVSSWRTSSPSQSNTQSSSRTSTTTITNNSTSSWRNSTPTEFNRPRTSNRPVVVHDPWIGGWGWNRWNMWGAPSFGWNMWTPMWYFNDFGYRQPARVYYYNDGRRDTVRGKKPIISFGLQHTSNKQLGAFFTIGGKGYFITEFNTTYERDRSTFFPNGTIDRVDFPLKSDVIKMRSFYFGGGKRIGRAGIHAAVGITNERILWRGYDQVGEITFPKSNQTFTTFKLGALKDFKNLSLKMDYDLVLKNGSIGLGFNL
jgi:hypothetical protein